MKNTKLSKMTSNHTSQDFDFQYYVDMVKQNEIAWHVFEKLMKDSSYSDVNRLKYFNAILLNELSISKSDMDRLKYLNVILMGKFKDCIQIDNDTNLEINHDLNDETLKESSSDREIQISVVIKIEKQENFDMPIHKFIDFNEIEDDAEICENEDAVDESNSTIVDYDFNEDTTEVSKNENLEGDHDLNIETITEISSCGQNEKQGKYFIQTEDDVELSENEDREVSLKSTNDHDRNDQTMIDISFARENEEHDNSDSQNIKNNASIARKNKRQQNLDSQINKERKFESTVTTFNNGYKDYKCESCTKLFTSIQYLN